MNRHLRRKHPEVSPEPTRRERSIGCVNTLQARFLIVRFLSCLQMLVSARLDEFEDLQETSTINNSSISIVQV